jgi:hypothetical protein
MENRILNFSDFILESTINRPNYWEVNYPDKWKALQDLGFVDVTTDRMKKNGNNIIIKNDNLPLYPAGIYYQDSGYLRNVAAKNGFITRDMNWVQAADYLIDKFSKLKQIIPSGVPPKVFISILEKLERSIVSKSSGKKVIFDPSSKEVTVKSTFVLHVDEIPEFISLGYKLGHVDSFKLKGDLTRYPEITKAQCDLIFPSECNELEVLGVKFSSDCQNVPIFPPARTSINVNIEGIKNLKCLSPDQPQKIESLKVISDLESLYGLYIIQCEKVNLRVKKNTGPRPWENKLTGLTFPDSSNDPYYSGVKTTGWDIENWVKVLREGNEEQKKLMITLPMLDSNFWNERMEENPGETIHILAPIWNDPGFTEINKGIKIPPGYEDQLDLFSGFSELGLF